MPKSESDFSTAWSVGTSKSAISQRSRSTKLEKKAFNKLKTNVSYTREVKLGSVCSIGT